MASNVPWVKMSNGKQIPIIGLATWNSKPPQVLDAVKIAIDVGYRHIDCASVYKNEEAIGQAIKQKIDDKTIKREDIFVTTKCWNTYHRREKVLECCEKSLAALGLGYIDLYLIHWPIAFQEGDELYPEGDSLLEVRTVDTDYIETWKGMEDCYQKGLVKSIGLSNFNSKQIKRVLDACSIKPVMLQVECHAFLNQHKLIEFCNKHGIAVTAFSPLASSGRLWVNPNEPRIDPINERNDSIIEEIAERHSKNSAQILLRFNVQRGVIVIPKSVYEDRIRSNFQIFDFELTPEEMATIGNFKEHSRYCHVGWLKNDRNYPFNEEF